MHPVVTVLKKELRENVRDRRSMISALLFGTVLMPLLFVGLLSLSVRRGETESNTPIVLSVVHGERAPNLLAELREYGIILTPANYDDATARDAARHLHRLVLMIPPEYATRLAAAEPAPLLLYADSSDATTARDVARLTSLLGRYSSELARLRIMARGIDPLILSAVAVQSVDVATPAARSALMLGMLSFLALSAMLTGGLHLSLDATAGERERGSLEPLLTVPVRREYLIYGKVLAACVFMLLTLSLCVCAMALGLHYAGLEDVGMNAHLAPLTVLAVIACCTPLAPLGASLMTIIAAFTRSYREAQTYVGLVVLVPTLPLVFASTLGLRPTTWLMAVPWLSQHFLITSLLREESIMPLYLALSVGITLTLGAVAAFAAGRLYQREALLG